MIDMLCSKEECCGCSACLAACPSNCISMNEDKEGFLYPYIDEEQCVKCGLCEKACPSMKKYHSSNAECKAYAAASIEEEIRLKSSSGGVFYWIAEKLLQEGGVVFGAALTTDCTEVRHIQVRNLDELSSLMGSKYVQSVVGETYRDVKRRLVEGYRVLFSGTPCQVNGLKRYLSNIDTTNLCTIDFICHGVPSPGVWRRYLKETGMEARRVFFRDKTSGWKDYSLKIIDESGEDLCQSVSKNAYLRGFLNHLYCRPSCHHCNFKGLERVSDITLGDFWKIDKFLENLDDNKGNSLLFVHSEKGEALLDDLQKDGKIVMLQVDAKSAAESNPMTLESIHPHKKRKQFYSQFEYMNVAKNVDKCLKKTILERVNGKIRWILFHK